VAGGDCDDADPGDRTGVRDCAGGGGEDGLAWETGQIQAAMAGEPRLGGVVEAVEHDRSGSERPGGGRRRREAGRRVRW